MTVRVAPGELNDAEAEVVSEARASPDVYSVIGVDQITDSQEEACDFSGDIECDPPLRGSVRITGAGVCTAGFNVESRDDAKPYVLTAGHCDGGSQTWYTQFADESSHAIGPFHNSQNDDATDAGILRVNNPSGGSSAGLGSPSIRLAVSLSGRRTSSRTCSTRIWATGCAPRWGTRHGPIVVP